jgi:hypothetical protein
MVRGKSICSKRILDAELVARNIVVAIEFQFVEGCCDAKPAGHGGRFNTRDASFTDDDDVSPAHGAADENDFEFNLSFECELAGTKKKDAARTDVACDQSNGEVFGPAIHAAKTQWKAQGSSGIFAMFGKHADGVGRHSRKAAHRIEWLEWHHAK